MVLRIEYTKKHRNLTVESCFKEERRKFDRFWLRYWKSVKDKNDGGPAGGEAKLDLGEKENSKKESVIN
ncbi:hypothetical protein CJF31_00009277 [Rutstroemia sp. NJR-2017a BVV2]|nr:hypothetical protein CJF31_00009277 [Rutstroemia sp. NJR-2017a BVV2]